MAAPLQIKVLTSLPLTVAFDGNLNVDSTNWRWAIQLDPGVVLGAQRVLSTSFDSLNTMSDNAVPLLERADVYYHINNEEKRRIFPLDPRGRSHYISSVHTPLEGDFWRGVTEWDGKRCVLTRFEGVFCDAVHLLSQSKGDGYISTYTQHRSGNPTGDDIIQDTANIRNGLFLSNAAHRVLGVGLASLKTPNFAMNTSDIDPTAPPTEKSCTAHFFKHRECPMLQGLSGSPVSLPDTTESPPAILFDAVYANAVLRHFGTSILEGHPQLQRNC